LIFDNHIVTHSEFRDIPARNLQCVSTSRLPNQECIALEAHDGQVGRIDSHRGHHELQPRASFLRQSSGALARWIPRASFEASGANGTPQIANASRFKVLMRELIPIGVDSATSHLSSLPTHEVDPERVGTRSGRSLRNNNQRRRSRRNQSTRSDRAPSDS
jgi:hypothetical protein